MIKYPKVGKLKNGFFDLLGCSKTSLKFLKYMKSYRQIY